MNIKKTTTFTIIVTVVAIAAITIIIAWLSANLPSAGIVVYEPNNNYMPEIYPTMPSEAYPPDEAYEHTIPPYEAYQPTQDDTNANDEEYHEATINNNDADYPVGDEHYPYDDYIFTPIFTNEPLPEHIIQQITGVTFHDTAPFGHDFLTYLTVTHVNFYGESVIGHLIVAADIGYEVLDIFREIYEGGFPIHSIQLIDYFDASDYLSMAANNSHAFNFRYIAGTNIISRHGFGVAIDINPVQNPYIRGDTIWPAAGAAYVDRSYVRPGMIIPGDVVYTAFMSRGWTWGGYWNWPRDYHHFERR